MVPWFAALFWPLTRDNTVSNHLRAKVEHTLRSHHDLRPPCFHESQQSHFLTFSCYHRQPKFNPAPPATCFRSASKKRPTFAMRIYGYVVMPEHVHP